MENKAEQQPVATPAQPSPQAAAQAQQPISAQAGGAGNQFGDLPWTTTKCGEALCLLYSFSWLARLPAGPAISRGLGDGRSSLRAIPGTRSGDSPGDDFSRIRRAAPIAPATAVSSCGRRLRGWRDRTDRRGSGGLFVGLIVEVRDLFFAYEDGTRALNGINFDLKEGCSIALMGANGSGKTTFIHHLNGILNGTGSVIVDGLPVTPGNLREIRRRVGLVFQDSDNQLFMPTVLEDVAFGLLAAGSPGSEATERARAAPDRVGILHLADRAPWHLSAGEKKRAALAGILATEPKLLVLDEPTTMLDPPGQRALANLLTSLAIRNGFVDAFVDVCAQNCNYTGLRKRRGDARRM